MTDQPNAPAADQPSPWLVRKWTIAGIVSGSARFIPVPFVDDYVQAKCRRFTVETTLHAHDAEASLPALEAYYGDSGGFVSNLGRQALRIPVKLALFPIRKPLRMLTSVRGVPLEILRMIALGRTLDRYLRGETPAIDRADDGSPALDEAVAKRLRRAFDAAFARMDFRAVRAAMQDVVAGVSEFRTAMLATSKRKDVDDERFIEELEEHRTIEEETDRVQQALERREVQRLLEDFDERFDQEFAKRNA